MLNPAPKGNDQQIAVTAVERAALIVAPEKIEFLNFLVDKTESIGQADVQERLDGEGRYTRQVSEQVQAEEDQLKELKRETSFLGGALRFAGAIVGFHVGRSGGSCARFDCWGGGGRHGSRAKQHHLARPRARIFLSQSRLSRRRCL